MSVTARLGIGFMKVLARLPLPVVRGLGAGFGHLLYGLARPRRHVVDVNLKLCFPHKSDAERARIARQTFVYVAQAWLDRSWLWHAPAEVIDQRVRIVGAIDEIDVGNAPTILFAPHFYGLDAAATALTKHNPKPSTTIYTTQRDPMVDEWTRKGRTRFGNVTVLHRVDGIKEIVAGLRKGGVLYLLPDMDFGPTNSIFVPFYGIPAATVPSLSRFARLGKAKVVPVVSRFVPGGYEIEVMPAWKDFPSDDAQADTALATRRLEALIDTMPEQYYWVHRRFKTRPPGEPPLY
ncbi:lipid A biosynthesis acyltransferase [Xenophilus arseniciresistens]|uniref:Lipid A biosynthesis acyltransferase n=1 Tax=Xenophilus arseniciresistens TaxID=1283306 RepID=A0AAE3SYV1_9BURK|nr:lipid A biosynthesis acyltransferase [Xenophilus arseniciresistens]MDA7416492.1 lipid A biosynthesis acyltransferase [Xenophilus arseniciresistens]